MLRIFFFLFLYVFSTSYVLSDISIKSLSLGISPEKLQTQLKSEGFIFLSISEDKIEARKLAYVSGFSGFSEYRSFTPSIELSAEICNGRVNKISYQTVFQGNQRQLLMGRKEIYQYLVDNEAQLQRIGINQNETSSQVVETFVIDRNAVQGTVKGEEIVSFALAESTEFQNTLKLDVRMSNNWFCPE